MINYDLLLFYREIRLFWKRFIRVFINYRTHWRINAKVIDGTLSFLPRKFFTNTFSSPSFPVSPNAITSAYMSISDSRKRTNHIESLPIPASIKDYLREHQYYVENLEGLQGKYKMSSIWWTLNTMNPKSNVTVCDNWWL